MFYDERVKVESAKSRRLLKRFKFTMSGTAIALLPPFVVLAIAPMMLMLVPVAFIVMPFMIPAFFSGAHANQMKSRRIRAQRLAVLRPAFAA